MRVKSKCRQSELCKHPHFDGECDRVCYYNTVEIKTNADRIRAMSDEEMAEWLCDIAGWLPMYEGKMHQILDWLRREAE